MADKKPSEKLNELMNRGWDLKKAIQIIGEELDKLQPKEVKK